MTIAALGCQRAAGQDERAGACHGRGGAVVRAVDDHRALALNGERCAFGKSDSLVECERLAVGEHERHIARHGDGVTVGQSAGGHCIGAVTPCGNGVVERGGGCCRLLHGDALYTVASLGGNVQRDGLALDIAERGLARLQRAAAVAVGHADSALSLCGRMGDLCHGIYYLIHSMHDLLPVASVFAAAAVVVIEHGTQLVIERNVFSEVQRAADACTGSAATTITVIISFDGSAGTDGYCHFSTVYAQSTVYGYATGSSFIIFAESITTPKTITYITSAAARGYQRSAAHGHIAADCCSAVAQGVVVSIRTATAAIAARDRQCSTCQSHRAVDGYATGIRSSIIGPKF